VSSAFLTRFTNETFQAVTALRNKEVLFPLPPGVINEAAHAS
jgi:hypothetical protein